MLDCQQGSRSRFTGSNRVIHHQTCLARSVTFYHEISPINFREFFRVTFRLQIIITGRKINHNLCIRICSRSAGNTYQLVFIQDFYQSFACRQVVLVHAVFYINHFISPSKSVHRYTFTVVISGIRIIQQYILGIIKQKILPRCGRIFIDCCC